MSTTDVKNLLISTIEGLGYSGLVYLQGSLSKDDAYPDSFFTFWNNYTEDTAFFDNEASDVVWNFDLNFYSKTPSSVNTELLRAKEALKVVGFIPDGSGHDVLSDELTHTGRGMSLLFIEKVR